MVSPLFPLRPPSQKSVKQEHGEDSWKGFNNLTGGKVKTSHEREIRGIQDASLMFDGGMKDAKSSHQTHLDALSERAARAG